MIPYKTYAVVGGDLRQAHIANRLAQMGKKVRALLLEKNDALDVRLRWDGDPIKALGGCEVVVLPLPLSTDEKTVHSPFSDRQLTLQALFDAVPSDTIVFAGKAGTALEQAETRGIHMIDYFEREELALQNAVITAEGAIAIAIDETPHSLMGAHLLVTGHGRIARALLRMLPVFGAQVSCAARSFSDLAAIAAQGIEAIPIAKLPEAAQKADLIFNTVPAQIFTETLLVKLRPETLLIDLASKPGGVDFEAARQLGVRTIWALSLPGRTAPITAGEIILQTISNCLCEQEVI